MRHELKEGVELSAVHLMPAGPDDDCLSYVVGVENPRAYISPAESIIVRDQKGPMDWMPWAEVTLRKGPIIMVNLANVESVELA